MISIVVQIRPCTTVQCLSNFVNLEKKMMNRILMNKSLHLYRHGRHYIKSWSEREIRDPWMALDKFNTFYLIKRSIGSTVDRKGVLIYEGPMSSTLRRLKRVSALTFFLSLFSAPFMAAAPNSSGMMIMALMAGVIGGSGASTCMIQYCGNPYVLKIYRNKDADELTIETTTFFGKSKEICVPVSKLEPSDGRPFTTWKTVLANGGKQYFHIHETLLENNKPLQEIHGAITGNIFESELEAVNDRLMDSDKSKNFDDMIQKLKMKPK